jgi:hypothetical protein
MRQRKCLLVCLRDCLVEKGYIHGVVCGSGRNVMVEMARRLLGEVCVEKFI